MTKYGDRVWIFALPFARVLKSTSITYSRVNFIVFTCWWWSEPVNSITGTLVPSC